MKKTFYSEAAYIIGLIILALGVAFTEKAAFGMSMVVAPAYLIHLKVSQYLPFFTFGMSEYVFQAVLLIVLAIVVRRFKISYLLSFVTAFIYGHILDVCMIIVGYIPLGGMAYRIFCYVFGISLGALGIAMLFHTYLTPEAYELFVKEFSDKYHTPLDKTKIVYDCCSCLLGIIFSFAFFGFGHFVGVSWGTVVCALVNGWMIGRFGNFLESRFEFRDAFKWRSMLNW